MVLVVETATAAVRIGSQRVHSWGDCCRDPLHRCRVRFWTLAAGERPGHH